MFFVVFLTEYKIQAVLVHSKNNQLFLTDKQVKINLIIDMNFTCNVFYRQLQLIKTW